VIVVDEFAELAAELEQFVTGLVAIARRGRSLGVHLVLATQRPGGVVSPEIRANTAARIALRVTDPAESRDVIDTDDAALLDRRHPGRAYLRVAGSAPVALQTAHLGPMRAEPDEVPLDGWRRPVRDAVPEQDGRTELGVLVEALRAAASGPPPHSPWLPPLPAAVPVETLGAHPPLHVPIGLLDVPARQQQRPLVVDLDAGGSLLLAGGPRSGRTAALLTLAVTAAGGTPPERLQLFGIDCGGGLSALRRLPHCGALLGPDPDAVGILLDRLGAEVGMRRTRGDAEARLVLLLDGWERFCAAAEEHGAAWPDDLLELIRAGPAAGLTVAVAGGRDALAPRLSGQVGTRILLQLPDRADYGLAGVSPAAVPARQPPGRAVRADDGLELQVAHLGDEPGPAGQDGAVAAVRDRWRDRCYPPGAIRVRTLPRSVALAELPVAPDGPLVLGVGGAAAEPVRVDLWGGQARLLVTGPPRSGRSTALVLLVRQLAGRGTSPLVAAPAHSPLARAARELRVPCLAPDDALPVADPAVVLVDDSEAFLDTPAGDGLLALVRARGPALPVVAAANSDEVAIAFRGLGAEVRRSRCALLLAPGPADGELVGLRLPRRRGPVPPGRGVLAGDPAWGPPFAAPLPVQVARPG
jgi:S-DNA-T family DNA segregation ATPase FtsK/SpoIIIE